MYWMDGNTGIWGQQALEIFLFSSGLELFPMLMLTLDILRASKPRRLFSHTA